MPTVTIDGRPLEARAGETVLQAALRSGVYIPHLCYHPDLDPVGVCRLCMVEIDGRMTIACKTPVADGMVVRTETPQVDKVRRVAVELLIANHPEDCLACAQNNQCELQRVAAFVGVDPQRVKRLRRTEHVVPVDDSNPFFVRDANRCVLCGVCVRTCEQLQGVCAIDYISRGFKTTTGTFGNRPIIESRCESCGECVVRCPTGALAPKNFQQPTREVATVCPYCGVGCGILLGVRGGKIVGARGNLDSPVNRGSLCVKGRFGYEFVNHPRRLTSPLVKEDGRFVEVGWDEALDRVAEGFAKCKGEKFAVIASAKCSSEENYVAQKFARAVMGTNHIDHCARL